MILSVAAIATLTVGAAAALTATAAAGAAATAAAGAAPWPSEAAVDAADEIEDDLPEIYEIFSQRKKANASKRG